MPKVPSSPEEVPEKLPLSAATFFALFSLAEGPKHGYKIMLDIRELSAGTFSVGPATLYTTLKRLSEQGLIKEILESQNERRRTYSLTSAGQRLLQAEFHRQQQLLDLARRKRNESYLPLSMQLVRSASQSTERRFVGRVRR
jgi:DNA-binding PadR family transcriptional regulator